MAAGRKTPTTTSASKKHRSSKKSNDGTNQSPDPAALPGIDSRYPVDDALLAAVVNFAQDSIVITTVDLDDPGPRIVYVNPAFTRMTGYLAEEVVGRTPRLLQGPNTDRNVLRRLKETLQRDEIFYGQAINYRKDGEEFWNEWHIEPIRGASGQPTYYIAIQHDITERKRMEASVLQKNAALREVLDTIQQEKDQLREEIALNITEVVLPALERLRRKGTRLDKNYIAVIEKTLDDLTSSFGLKVSERKLKLSPREVEIANLIKHGMSNKEIADTLNISIKTIETHRNKIRKKLGVIHQDINLTSYLQAM